MSSPWLSAFVFITITLCACSAKHDKPPTWPQSYQVSGTLSLPYAELKEPFEAYYDGKKMRSRMDFYGDTVQNYLRGDVGAHGTSYKLAYMTNQTHYNMRGCFMTEGTKDATITPQSVLPNLTSFEKVGSPFVMNGMNVTMWYYEETHGTKKSKYTMYLSTDDSSPVRYEMYGYDSLLGSHFDKYYVDYSDYQAHSLPDEVFSVPDNNTCGGFPGPGDAESRVVHNPFREFIDKDDSHHKEMFTKFKKFHKKEYDSDKEHAHRESNFKHNVRYIHSKNRSPITYRMAVNHLADMSHAELKMRNGRRYSGVPNSGKPFDKSTATPKAQLPDLFDWRLYGAVTPVKDQAVCGSCWSFGTTGTIEGAYFKMTGKRVRLSQQELMDCSWGYGNNACDGGEDFRAYDWIIKNPGGLASEDDYGHYMAVDSKCNSRGVNGTVELTGYINITQGDQLGLKMALFDNGPISVAIDASHLSLSFYADGVYYEKDCKSDPDGLDHAVLAVGYGTMHGQDYWLIKNSWSTYWGNDGYVLMSMKDNNCGVATSATYPQLKKK